MKRGNKQKNNWLKVTVITVVFLAFILSWAVAEASLIGSVNTAVQNISNTQPVVTSGNQTTAVSNNSSLIQGVNTSAQNTYYNNNQNYNSGNYSNNSSSNINYSNQNFNPVVTQTSYPLPSCPFNWQSGRTIVNFNNEYLVVGHTTEIFRNVNLPAGEYRVSLASADGYTGRDTVTQGNESYFVELRNGSSVVARTNSTPDLQDRITFAQFSGVVSTVNLPQSINMVVARHANYLNSVAGPNSVSAGCAAFDLITTTPPPPPVQNLDGSCSVNPGNVNVGGYLNWSTTASGGSGSYVYSWSGTDNLSANASSVSKAYFTAGTKIGTVTITSGTQSITRTCSAVVNSNIVINDFSVSCSASPSNVDVDENVTWRALVSGGTGAYTYSWSGTDGLNGNSQNITRRYNNQGTKNATVTVTSDGQSLSASCMARVDEEEEDNDDLSVSCYASPSNIQTGDRVTWRARVSGGDGNYDYDWTGSDGLNSSSQSPARTYNTPGSKRATVIVTDDDGDEDSATCYANVNSVLAFNQEFQAPMAEAVYLNQIPYTGVADNYRLLIFIGLLALISAWMAYIIVEYKKQAGELN